MQAVTFLPYEMGALHHKPDYLKRLILPLAFGIISFPSGCVCVFSEIVRTRSDPDRPS
jgi:hypothetical protein